MTNLQIAEAFPMPFGKYGPTGAKLCLREVAETNVMYIDWLRAIQLSEPLRGYVDLIWEDRRQEIEDKLAERN